jgi:hypothetical protein
MEPPEKAEEVERASYEEPTLEKREELTQVTETLAGPAVPAVPVLTSQ